MDIYLFPATVYFYVIRLSRSFIKEFTNLPEMWPYMVYLIEIFISEIKEKIHYPT